MSAIYSGVARVGRDAEVRYVPSGEAVVNLSLAFSYGKRDADGKRPTTWVEAGLWGKRAETLAPYLVKGQQVWVTIQDLRIETFTKSDGTQGHKLAGRIQERYGMSRDEAEKQVDQWKSSWKSDWFN